MDDLQGRLARIRQTPEYEYHLLASRIAEQIFLLMEERGVSRSDLARRMGVSQARVTQILRGSDNLTLKTLAAVAHALDAHVEFTLAEGTSQDTSSQAAEHPERQRHARSA